MGSGGVGDTARAGPLPLLLLDASKNLPALESGPRNAQGCLFSLVCGLWRLWAEGKPGRPPLVLIAPSISGAGVAGRLLVINTKSPTPSRGLFPMGASGSVE